MRNHIITTLVVLFLGVLGVMPALAQTFIEPTSPLGGQTAWPLNSSSNTQYKRGSLIIGSATIKASLCLNSDNVVVNDPTRCIQSWSELRGNYVTLSQRTLGANASLSDHKLSDTITNDLGFIRVKADQTRNQLYTIIAEANGYATNTATAIYATDSGLTSNYAAIFSGRVYVGYGTSTDTQICLNGTNPVSTATGKGCIKSWADLAQFAPPANYVILQSKYVTPTPQSGQLSVSSTGSFASNFGAGVTIGAPQGTVDTAYTCKDGICNGAETAAICPNDCDVTPPADITLDQDIDIIKNVSTGIFTVTFTWTNPSDTDFKGTRILRRQDGWPTGPEDPLADAINGSIRYSSRYGLPSAGMSYTQNNLASDKIYYYKFYSFDAYTGTTPHNFANGVGRAIDTSDEGSVRGACPPDCI